MKHTKLCIAIASAFAVFGTAPLYAQNTQNHTIEQSQSPNVRDKTMKSGATQGSTTNKGSKDSSNNAGNQGSGSNDDTMAQKPTDGSAGDQAPNAGPNRMKKKGQGNAAQPNAAPNSNSATPHQPNQEQPTKQ